MNNQNLVHNNGAFIAMASPPMSLTEIQSVLKQILQSQETCLQTMSNCVNTLSSINSDLSSFNQQQTYVPYKPFYHQQQLKTSPITFVSQQTAPPSFVSQTTFKHHTPPSIPTFQSATEQYWASHPPSPNQQHTSYTSTSFNNPSHHYLYQDPFNYYPTYQDKPSTITTSPASSTTTHNIHVNTHYPHLDTHYSTFRSEPTTSNITHTNTQQPTHTPFVVSHPPFDLCSHLPTGSEPLSPAIKGEKKIAVSQKLAIGGGTSITDPNITTFGIMSPPERSEELINNVDVEIVKEPSPLDSVTTAIVEKSVFTVSENDEKSTAYQAMGFAPDSLSRSCSNIEQSFYTTATLSSGKKVVRAAAVAETPSQYSRFFFDFSAFYICIFDPGGPVAVSSVSVVRHRVAILQFGSFAMFTFCYGAFFSATTLLPSHLVTIAWSISLLWEPWDRGKKVSTSVSSALPSIDAMELRVNTITSGLHFGLSCHGPNKNKGNWAVCLDTYWACN